MSVFTTLASLFFAYVLVEALTMMVRGIETNAERVYVGYVGELSPEDQPLGVAAIDPRMGVYVDDKDGEVRLVLTDDGYVLIEVWDQFRDVTHVGRLLSVGDEETFYRDGQPFYTFVLLKDHNEADEWWHKRFRERLLMIGDERENT